MAELKIKSEFVGPGERKTAERLRDELPSDWVIFAGRKLAGETRDDVDLIVVGNALVFLLEEKAWGPRLVVDDNNWYVNGQARLNPLNRTGQLARKLAGLLRDHARGYKALKGKRVIPSVVLSHDSLEIYSGRNHDVAENIWPLADTASTLVQMDLGWSSMGDARRAVLAYLDDMPAGDKSIELGDYKILGRHAVPGLEQAYDAMSPDGQNVILKCYPIRQFEEHGDPRAFLERETRALNKLADLGRTWRALPYFESDAHNVFVVPVVPPAQARSLEASVRVPGPEREGDHLDSQVAREVAIDAFSALGELHEYGLVHRALHPRRIWLGRRLRVMFSDFHLARMSGATTIALWAPDHDISDDFRAPECAADVALATAKSDIYSLTLCVAGWLLGEDVTELTHDQIRQLLVDSFPWAEPMLGGLANDPKSRPTAEDLAASLRPSPVVAPAPPEDVADVFAVDGSPIAGRYKILRQLGKGGFATSWLVYDQQAEHTKVLKQFHHGIPAELRAEYRAADQLRHDRCGRVYDVQLDKDPHYLVSEYVEGESLAERGVERSVEELRNVAAGILQALTYIHGKGLVHGDVTPANVIVSTDGSGEAKLIDFGLAVPSGQRPAGASPRFAAPEVLAGHSATPQSDLYGFSVTMAHAMLGRQVARLSGTEVELLPPTEDELESWGAEGAALLRAIMLGASVEVGERPKTADSFLTIINSARPSIPKNVPGDVVLEPRINENVTAIRRLYRASAAGNAGNRGLDDAFAKETYVQTLLDTQLLPRVVGGELDVVLLSGNPGDGKTSVLVQLGDELRQRGAVEEHVDEAGWKLKLGDRTFIAVYDASESHGDLSSDALVKQALDPVLSKGPATALIAVNDGRLLQFFTDYEDDYEEWSFSLSDQLNGQAADDSGLVLVDLKRRTLAGADGKQGLAGKVMSVLTEEKLWAVCGECSAQSSCPILANRELLAGDGAETFEELMLISHLRRRRRATFRDARSAAAWLITGDRSCEDIHEWERQGRSARYLDRAQVYDLAFATDSNDYLVDEWSELDPGIVAAPQVDGLRRSLASDPETSHYGSVAAVARALYFRALRSDDIDPSDVRAYRYLSDFLEMLEGRDPAAARDRLLLGISRLVGAFGYLDEGLAMSSGMAGSSWAVLHTVPRDQFEVRLLAADQRYIETMPDQLTLHHSAGPNLTLTLDTAEIILRAADGEVVDDPASDAIRQEIDSFASQLGRQPSHSARIVDSSGSVAVARVHSPNIVLEQA